METAGGGAPPAPPTTPSRAVRLLPGAAPGPTGGARRPLRRTWGARPGAPVEGLWAARDPPIPASEPCGSPVVARGLTCPAGPRPAGRPPGSQGAAASCSVGPVLPAPRPPVGELPADGRSHVSGGQTSTSEPRSPRVGSEIVKSRARSPRSSDARTRAAPWERAWYPWGSGLRVQVSAGGRGRWPLWINRRSLHTLTAQREESGLGTEREPL